jgi:sigma-54 specific flagellar transcriptional regulator A
MIENGPILLIDDDDESSQNLRTVLAFLGESITPVNTAAWNIQVEESGLKSSQFSAAIVANCNGKRLASLIQELNTWEGGLPFILVGEQHLPEELDPQLHSAITAQLPTQLSYQPLLDALHKANFMKISIGSVISTECVTLLCFAVS